MAANQVSASALEAIDWKSLLMKLGAFALQLLLGELSRTEAAQAGASKP